MVPFILLPFFTRQQTEKTFKYKHPYDNVF
jgi:hypothetical protein